jgi:hypothetical protein
VSDCHVRSALPLSNKRFGQARHHRPVRRHAGSGCGACCRARRRRCDRRGHAADGQVSDACRRLMTIPGVGQFAALAFTTAVDDPGRFRRSRDVGAYLGLVPRRYQSGEIDYTGSISKCGDWRVRTLSYEAANVMLTRYKGPLKPKDWGPSRSPNDPRCGRRGLRSRDALPSSCMRCCDTAPTSQFNQRSRAPPTRQEVEPSSRVERRPREGADDGADCVTRGHLSDCDFNQAAPHPADPIKCP